MTDQTIHEYREVISRCKTLFASKNADYGVSWRILRLPSITDQIFIKAQRIRSIQEKQKQKINDSIQDEFIGIINYCLIALIQLKLGTAVSDKAEKPLAYSDIEPLYDHFVNETLLLLEKKNHDYDEAWRDMRVNSMTDIILMKLFRVKQIEEHNGKTFASEGVAANYQDIINYAVFCLITLGINVS